MPAAPEAVDAVERERSTRWWLEESGLPVDELHAFAVGLAVRRLKGAG